MELDEKECSFSSQRVFFDESKREGKKILKFALNSRRALSEDWLLSVSTELTSSNNVKGSRDD